MAAIPLPGEEFETAPMGTHIAICSRIIDLGTQPVPVFGSSSGETEMKHQIVLGWELPNERMSNGVPFLVISYYLWSMHEKASLRKALESWRGQKFTKDDFGKFEIKNVLGKPCQVIIGESQTGKAKVMGVAGFPKGTPTPKLHDEPIYVWLSAAEFDEAAYEQLSDFWKTKIKATPEWASIHAPKSLGNGSAKQHVTFSEEMSDEIPFATSEGIW